MAVILGIHAHPDDIETLGAGTLAVLVFLIVLSRRARE